MTAPKTGEIAPLPQAISIVAGTDVDELWNRFRFFEAGHHLMDIMNPLSDAGLDDVVARLRVQPGDRVLDIACGHGDFAMRVAALQPASVCGVDLSPWTIRRARRRIDEVGTEDSTPIELWIGDGRAFVDRRADDRWDVIALIGAPWVWGGFDPAMRALADRLRPGGRLVIADIVAVEPAARERLPKTYGNPGTIEEQRQQILGAGLVVLDEVATEPADWRAYDDRVMAGIRAWLTTFPDDRSYLDHQLEYEGIRHGDDDAGWHVWIVGPSQPN